MAGDAVGADRFEKVGISEGLSARTRFLGGAGGFWRMPAEATEAADRSPSRGSGDPQVPAGFGAELADAPAFMIAPWQRRGRLAPAGGPRYARQSLPGMIRHMN